MITSRDNTHLKTIRKLHEARWRKKLDMFFAEGEDLVAMGWEPEFVLRAGQDVEPQLLDEVSTLGSGTRVIGVYRRRWSEPVGRLCVYLDGVADPGNVGTIIRSTHAFADGPVIIGERCADPFSPKAVRASMGSIFARPPARVEHVGELPGDVLALELHGRVALSEVPLSGAATIWVGAERRGLPEDLVQLIGATRVRIPMRADGPDSLNVAMAATVALYDVANRMAGHA